MNIYSHLLNKEQQEFFEDQGFLAISSFLTQEEIIFYRELYEQFLSGKIETGHLRSDLVGGAERNQVEKITQIMCPSHLVEGLNNQVIHQRALAISQQLLGDDMVVDFDMLIDKAPHSNTATPWHQDEAYWLNMADKRAVSCWVALDDADTDNGCMWFVPKSHKEAELRKHSQNKKGGALTCQASESEGVPVVYKAGDCTFHHGRTLHYSRGNITARRRRAFIVNFRPKAMVDYERAHGYDHTGRRSVKQDAAK